MLSDAALRRLTEDCVNDLRMARDLQKQAKEYREAGDWRNENHMQDAARHWITQMQTKFRTVETLVGGKEGRDLAWMVEDAVYVEVHNSKYHSAYFCRISGCEEPVGQYSQTPTEVWKVLQAKEEGRFPQLGKSA